MSRYQITPNGQITDEGKAIGWVEGGTNLVFQEGVEVSGQARAYLERLLKAAEGESVEVFEEEHTQEAMPPDPGREYDRPAPPGFYAEPPQDPRMGDKTPAWRNWFRMTHSQDEYQKRYAGRKVSDAPGPLYGGGDIPAEQTWKDNPEIWFKSMK
jgi:hypothetical protein